VLASGSSGNAALLATDSTRILIDAGLSMRELGKRMLAAGENLEDLDAILLTHEHCDHISGAPVLARRLKKPKPFFLTRLTGPAIDWEHSVPILEPFQAGASFRVGDIDVQSFSVPHDAIDPVGFCFQAQGVRIGVATDLGYIPGSVKFHLNRCDLLLIEANHDLEMLKVGPYPWSVKQRVMSRVGHLSNTMTCDFLADELDSRAQHVILGHVSEANNHPEIVRAVAEEALERRGFFAPRISVAEQTQISEVLQF
jgi:phosphoribosyl 1,2-cyclic phosphodiesterase